MSRPLRGFTVAAALTGVLVARHACAQDMEPRAYSSSPTGANFLVLGYGRSSGDVLFDPTLPLTDVHADLNAARNIAAKNHASSGRAAAGGLSVNQPIVSSPIHSG